MFRTTVPVTEPDEPNVTSAFAELIPLSVLQLDLPEPPGGWVAYLAGRNIPVLVDDVGRDSISRDNVRMLIAEKRDGEARAREIAQRQEREAVERDRQSRAQLSSGVPWWLIPQDVSPAEAIMRAGLDAERGKSVREQLLERELAHSEPELIYQSIGPDQG